MAMRKNEVSLLAPTWVNLIDLCLVKEARGKEYTDSVQMKFKNKQNHSWVMHVRVVITSGGWVPRSFQGMKLLSVLIWGAVTLVRASLNHPGAAHSRPAHCAACIPGFNAKLSILSTHQFSSPWQVRVEDEQGSPSQARGKTELVPTWISITHGGECRGVQVTQER